MNNFERILSLSPAELADLFAETFCPYQETSNCANKDCSDCFLKWLTEKHNGSGLTEYEKIHSMSLKKFAKDYALRLCLLISPDDKACSSNALCLKQPFICVYKWLNSEYKERK